MRGGLLLAGAGLLAGCSSPAPPAGGRATTASGGSGGSGTGASPFALDDSTKPAIDALFDSVVKSTGLIGAAGAIWMGDKTWKRSAGYANLEQKTPYDPAANVRIASITKSIVATAVLQLVDGGALALTDHLEKFVPGITNGTSITVENLLDMTAGVYEFTENADFNTRWYANPTMPWTFADTLALIKANKPLFAPGTDIFYADSNYVLLGEILEKVTGQSASKVVADNVVKKLGLTATFWPVGNSVPDPHPTAYVPTGLDPANPNKPFDNAASPPAIFNEVNPAVPAGSGAMISRLDDLHVWGKELGAGSLLKPETQARRLKARRFNGVKINIGYGMGCERVGGFVGHNGAIYGYTSVVFAYPPADLVLAAVGNESNNNTTPTTTFAYQFIQKYFPDQWQP